MSRHPRASRRLPVLLLVLAGIAAGFLWWTATHAGPARSGQLATGAASGSGEGSPITDQSADPAGPAAAGGAGNVGAMDASTSSSAMRVATAVPTGAKGRALGVSTTYASWDAGRRSAVVAGFVDGVIEDGGICTATLTQGSRTVRAVARGTADATTTTCPDIPVFGLSAGSWWAVLSYRSNVGAGAAAAVSVMVP